MEPDLVKRLRSARLTRGEVHSLAGQLPPDADLARLIERLVSAADEPAMTALLLVMVADERTIEARVLPGVIPLLADLNDVALATLQARGEVVEALLQTVKEGIVGWERQAMLLMIAGWICLHREPARPLPESLIPAARLLAREARGEQMALLPLFVLAHVTQNKALQAVLEEACPPPPPDVIAFTLKSVIEDRTADPLGFLPEQMDHVIHTGSSVRRAVAKVRRNDPCPCGSGKKYKKCCFDKDQERLRHSTEVAGVTTDELETLPEPFLTRERLEEMRSPKLARLRIEMLPPPLQSLLLERLSVFRQMEALLAAWEKVGWRADLKDAWDCCVFDAVRTGRREVVDRLVKLRGVSPDDDAVPFGARLLLLQGDPGALLRAAEAAALRNLKDPRDLAHIDLAYAFVDGHLPGLGTLVARGAAAAATPFDAMMLFESIHKVRDQLDLPPEDPGEWILDRAYDLPEDLDEAQREELDAARRQIEAASAEAGRLKRQLTEARAQLDRQERLASRNKSQPATATVNEPATAGPSLSELRARIAELKSALKERHAERNALRRELSDALEEAEALRRERSEANQRTPAPTAPDHEDLAFLAEEASPLQPPRLPCFPDRFAQTIDALPDTVVRAALSLAGQLAAGEPSAFVGMRRLRLRHDICRVRVGTDYRLLFRLQAEQLVILDLINRRDFERWLKALG